MAFLIITRPDFVQSSAHIYPLSGTAFLLGNIDAITASPNRFDKRVRGTGIFNLFAQFADKHIDDFHPRFIRAAIKMVKKALFRDNTAFTQAQKFERLIFL